MPTAEDRALAEALHRAGKLSGERLAVLLAALEADPQARLLDLLTPDDTGGASTGAPPPAPIPSPPGTTAAPPAAVDSDAAPRVSPPAPPRVEPPAPRSMTAPPPASAGHDSSPVAPLAGPARDPDTRRRGRVLRRIGRWDLHEVIGRGGLGVVYRATDTASRREVAVRILTASEAGTDRTDRFVRDARTTLPLRHPGIVATLDVEQVDDEALVAMEYVEGSPLESVLLERGAIAPRSALEIARDAARGLGAGHALGLVHRDVKPGNIFLAAAPPGNPGSIPDPDGGGAWRVRVADFGLAREAGSDAPGTPIGTPVTMSPEAANGLLSRIDARSDVYSLGCILYRMLTGVQPYPGNSLQELLPLITASEPVPVDVRRPGLHRDVTAIVQMAMARDPRHRYPDGNALAGDLDRYLRGEAIDARRPPLSWRVRRALSRHALAAALVVVALLSVAGAVGWNALQGSRRDLARLRDIDAHLAAGRAALTTEAWDSALREFEAALALSPGAPSAVQGHEDARYGRLAADVKRLVNRGKWDEALAAAAGAPASWRARPELAALEATARGTASIEITADGLWDVDVVAAEPGIAWDEEMLPGIQDARDGGLARPVGRTPIPHLVMPPGDFFLVWSRDGRAARMAPIRLARGEAGRAEFRIRTVRPGGDPAEALRSGRPGHVVELEGGEWTAGWFPAAGVLLRSAAGTRAALRAPPGTSAVVATGAFGASIRDIDFVGGAESAVLAVRTDRFSMARCRIRDFDKGGVAVEGGADAVLRELELERVDEQALRLAGERHAAIGCSFREVGWCAVSLEGGGHAVRRCDIRGSQRIGIHARGPGPAEIIENTLSGCPEWGILVANAPESRVLDNLLLDCSTASGTLDGASITAGGPCEIRHNTLVRGGHGIESRENLRPVADNIVWGASGTAFTLQSDACELFDYNLAWNCAGFASLRDRKAATLDELLAFPESRRRAFMAHGLQADPRFTDPDARDCTLRPDSPARNAASDGGDIGARFRLLADAPADSAAWLRRHQGRLFLERGRAALTDRDAPRARAQLVAARALLGTGPELEELLRRAAE